MKKLITLLFLINLSFLSFGQSALQDSLQLYYLFNGDASDVSGNGHDGTVFGASLTDNRFGQPNSAYEFDGYYDHINTYSTFDFEERTVSLWVKPYDISGFDPNNHVVISQDDNNLKYGCLRVDFEGNNINLWSGGADNIYTEEAYEMRYEWSHIVMTRDADLVKYYVNGSLVKVDYSNNIGSTFNPDSNLVIGAGRTIEQFFFGKIDDIRIYNRVLSEGEIQDLFLIDIQGGINVIEMDQDYNSINLTFNNGSRYQIEVIDALGRILFKENITSNKYLIDRSILNKGLNIIQITKGNKQIFVRKIIN